MQERSVTVRGEKHPLPRPFQVLATQNPLEMEGTYPLPEAQIDRFFFKILVEQPSETELVSIIERTVGTAVAGAQPVMDGEELQQLQKAVREVVVPSNVTEYAARLVLATQPSQEKALSHIRQFVRFGAGPRGAQTLILAGKARALMNGRFNVSFEDIQRLLLPALRHRIGLNFDGQSEGIQIDQLLLEILKEVHTTVDRPGTLKIEG